MVVVSTVLPLFIVQFFFHNMTLVRVPLGDVGI